MFNFLTDWQYFVSIDSNVYNILYTNFSVPQGFLLGPIIFIWYVGAVKSILDGSEFIWFNDDSIVFT